MKKQNKIYLPLKEQGIKKAWDKAAVFRTNYGGLRMVVYYSNKPFECWALDDAFDVKDIRLTLDCMLDYYGKLALKDRVTSKRLANFFLKNEAEEKVVTYKRGGVLLSEV